MKKKKKKKHLQFNDITAPSLARRAARRGAEKGESGRMEPGVISVLPFPSLLSFSSRKKQCRILPILSRTATPHAHTHLPPTLLSPHYSATILFCRLYFYSSFVELKLSIILFFSSLSLGVGGGVLLPCCHPGFLLSASVSRS